jgi:hypothetical protein
MKQYESGNTYDECEEDPTEMGDHGMAECDDDEEEDDDDDC